MGILLWILCCSRMKEEGFPPLTSHFGRCRSPVPAGKITEKRPEQECADNNTKSDADLLQIARGITHRLLYAKGFRRALQIQCDRIFGGA